MPNIVISYRRDDTKWIAGRMLDRLQDHYGRGNVFLDITNIPAGSNFPNTLRKTVERCDIVLALIGPKWFGADENGRSRLWDDADWVRIEIATALRKKIPVLPILIDNAKMPEAAELPEDLRELASVQAAAVDGGVDFRLQMLRLIKVIDENYMNVQSFGRLAFVLGGIFVALAFVWIIFAPRY
jgi:hypothetical protein